MEENACLNFFVILAISWIRSDAESRNLVHRLSCENDVAAACSVDLVFNRFIMDVQDVQKSCNGSYWNATDQTCLTKLGDIWEVFVIVFALFLVRLCSMARESTIDTVSWYMEISDIVCYKHQRFQGKVIRVHSYIAFVNSEQITCLG